MDALPFADSEFDAVVAFNAFPFADDPERAVAEAARVARTDGLVAATTFAEPSAPPRPWAAPGPRAAATAGSRA